MKPKYLRTEEIERRATELLTSCETVEVPVSLDLVAHRLGVSVDYAQLGDDVSGLLVVEEGRGVIGVNREHAPVRQRFTLAHEIGHYVLHRQSSELFIDKKYNAIFRDSKSSKGEDRVEIQANQFAAALIMPKIILEERINKGELDLGDDHVINELANEFGVSMQALVYRLSNLGIFDQVE